ncbi:hypothetical protein MSSAC_2793 [Methanosarcina siciliae C2J]|uniref:Uncharacterized protein n=1 Tax=Methanosarcina siciliae C2J TaxID=1434118 RepID=A0A0E3PNY8_9EURY|nr:hypothetical protein MSSAC_2793 [Methanosarcina siciliae C2J]
MVLIALPPQYIRESSIPRSHSSVHPLLDTSSYTGAAFLRHCKCTIQILQLCLNVCTGFPCRSSRSTSGHSPCNCSPGNRHCPTKIFQELTSLSKAKKASVAQVKDNKCIVSVFFLQRLILISPKPESSRPLSSI